MQIVLRRLSEGMSGRRTWAMVSLVLAVAAILAVVVAVTRFPGGLAVLACIALAAAAAWYAVRRRGAARIAGTLAAAALVAGALALIVIEGRPLDNLLLAVASRSSRGRPAGLQRSCRPANRACSSASGDVLQQAVWRRKGRALSTRR